MHTAENIYSVHDLQNFECILSSFEEIYPIWHDELWPGRIV